ncbi:MAG: hypothetical protein PHV93_04650 [Candidatus Pacebacteria bacterium]|nr:hypothetical protein [Candidatus Paceibacterota bacterium]
MVHTGIFATSSEILTKAGAKYSTAVTEAKINELCLQAESVINTASRYNWSDAYAGLNADVKYLLSSLESDYVAAHIIASDMSGYSSRSEAETMIDVLWARFDRNIGYLKDKEVQTFMVNA